MHSIWPQLPAPSRRASQCQLCPRVMLPAGMHMVGKFRAQMFIKNLVQETNGDIV